MNVLEKKVILIFSLLIISFGFSQERVITTGVSFLTVAADAKSAGMGDMGVATPTDAFSQQWNPAKYAFSNFEKGFSVGFTPYLTELSKDISLGQITYFKVINTRSAWASSLRFFGLGNVEFRNFANEQPRIVSPNELAIDGSYSLKLSDSFSFAVAGRYIRSNLKVSSDVIDVKAANTFAVDIAGYYQSEEKAFNYFNGICRAGFNIQNLGPKISYDNDDFNTNFLPSNLKIGIGYEFIFNEDNRFLINTELNKLLVPTPQKADLDGDGIVTQLESSKNNSDYQKIGWVSGLFKSFGDGPNGFKEELQEITYSLGAEYNYKKSFSLLSGYFNESQLKGARRFFSFGVGLKYSITTIDFSYLFSTSNVVYPLEKTIRCSITFNLGNFL